MKNYTNSNPVFSRIIKTLEVSDPGHADNVNVTTKQLLDNTLVLKDQLDANIGTPANYDEQKPYSVGEFCLYDGAIYKCTTAIVAGEKWNADHWEAISIVGELEQILTNIKLLVDNLVPLDKPVYGFIVHEGTDKNPESRVEYIGANKGFTPMKMNMETHVMDYGSWKDWSWLKGVIIPRRQTGRLNPTFPTSSMRATRWWYIR